MICLNSSTGVWKPTLAVVALLLLGACAPLQSTGTRPESIATLFSDLRALISDQKRLNHDIEQSDDSAGELANAVRTLSHHPQYSGVTIGSSLSIDLIACSH